MVFASHIHHATEVKRHLQVTQQEQQLELLQSHFDQLRTDFLHNENVLHEREEELAASQKHLQQVCQQLQAAHDALYAAQTSVGEAQERATRSEARCTPAPTL